MSVLKEQLAKRQAMEEEKKRAKESSSYQYDDYEKVQYLGLEADKEKVFRVLGKPLFLDSPMDRKPTDHKLILLSEIVNEARNKYVKVHFPFVVADGDIKPDPKFLLTKIHSHLKKGKWVKLPNGETHKVTGKDGYWDYDFKDKESFKIIVEGTGNTRPKDKFPKKYYPAKKVIMNVIDRHDSWCADNKHSKVLTSKNTPYTFKNDKNEEMTVNYTDRGIPITAYDKLCEYHAQGTGNFDVDSVMMKDGKDYIIHDVTDMSPKHITAESKAIGKDTPLTAEEQAYELYDLDKLFPTQTSYRRIEKELGWLIKKVDGDTGSNFMRELQGLVDLEKAEAEKNKESNPEPKEEVKKEEKVEEVVKQEEPKKEEAPVVAEEKREAPKRRESAPAQTTSLKEEIISYFPSWNALSDDEKAVMEKSIDSFVNGEPVYNKKGGEILACKDVTCKFPNTKIDTAFPEEVFTCPVCGAR